MSNDFSLKIEGTAEIIAKLKQIGAEATAIATAATMAGAEIVRAEAAKKAAQTSQKLADGMLKEPGTTKSDEVVVKVGPDKELFWGRVIEFGAEPHHITPNQAKALQTDLNQFAANANHPGVDASPFLRPALDIAADAVQVEIARQLKQKLNLE